SHAVFFFIPHYKVNFSARQSKNHARGSESNVEETQSVVALMAMPMFTPILPPRVTSISHEKQVMCRSERDTNIVVPVKSTVGPLLLETCCRLQWGLDVEAATDERVENELDKILRSIKNNGTSNIDEVFQLHGALALPNCADSGSDWNLISHIQLEQLKHKCYIESVTLPEPVISRAVGGQRIKSHEAIDVHLTFDPLACLRPECSLVVAAAAVLAGLD
ncbi:TPA: hypothetical protein N0F65_009574, partial [Lagenidium giganteum]